MSPKELIVVNLVSLLAFGTAMTWRREARQVLTETKELLKRAREALTDSLEQQKKAHEIVKELEGALNDPKAVHEAMQNAPYDGKDYRHARAAIRAIAKAAAS